MRFLRARRTVCLVYKVEPDSWNKQESKKTRKIKLGPSVALSVRKPILSSVQSTVLPHPPAACAAAARGGCE